MLTAALLTEARNGKSLSVRWWKYISICSVFAWWNGLSGNDWSEVRKSSKTQFPNTMLCGKRQLRKALCWVMPFLYSSEVSKVISFLGCDKVIRKSHLKKIYIYIVPKLAKAYNFFGCVKVIANGKKKFPANDEWPLEDRTRVGRITWIDRQCRS